MKTLALLVPLALLSGCVARVHTVPDPHPGPAPLPPRAEPTPAPAPMPPPPRELSAEQAASIALNYAASRGYSARVEEVERKEKEYRVELELAPRGEMKLDIDPWTGQVLKAKEKLEHDARDEHHDHGKHKGWEKNGKHADRDD